MAGSLLHAVFVGAALAGAGLSTNAATLLESEVLDEPAWTGRRSRVGGGAGCGDHEFPAAPEPA